jgi:hypothetical protein
MKVLPVIMSLCIYEYGSHDRALEQLDIDESTGTALAVKSHKAVQHKRRRAGAAVASWCCTAARVTCITTWGIEPAC